MFDEFSWFVGILEGEGYIGLDGRQKGKKPYPQIIIAMTDLDIIERVCKLVDCDYREYTPKGKTKGGDDYKRVYRVNICGEKAIYIMDQCAPYFSKRRKEKYDYIKENYQPKTKYKTPGYVPKPKKDFSYLFKRT